MIPALLAFLIASFYIIKSPGGLGADAFDYDTLAHSILTGHYNLNGGPSMLREPGYPMFRAILIFLGAHLMTILWIQAIMYAGTVFLVGLSAEKIDPRLGIWGAWGAALSYGLAFYPSTHLSENLTAFLAALIGFFFITALDNPRLRNWVLVALSGAALIYTRYAFSFIPLLCLVSLYIVSLKKGISKKEVIKKELISIVIIIAAVSPWILRNYEQFGEPNMAGLSGTIAYARAWKAEQSWWALGDSYISVFIGRGLLFTIYPTNQSIFQEQWGSWQRDPAQIKLWGSTDEQIDKARRKAALAIIFKNPNQFAKFALWTGVDDLRLFELPSPIIKAKGSPFEGTYGPLAKTTGLSLIQIIALAAVHIVQLIWWIALIASIILGFKKYRWRFVPGIFFIALIIPFSAVDNIPRFAVPLHPWFLAGVFLTVIPLIVNKFCLSK